MLKQEKFATKPINKVTRMEIIDYLEVLSHNSPTTIKERYRIIKRAFDYAYNKDIIRENFMDGYNPIGKPKSKVSKPVPSIIALSLEKEKILSSCFTYMYH